MKTICLPGEIARSCKDVYILDKSFCEYRRRIPECDISTSCPCISNSRCCGLDNTQRVFISIHNSRIRWVCFCELWDIGKDYRDKERGRAGRSLSCSDSNASCLPPSGRSHSVSVIRMHGESLRLNIAQASFSTDETMTHCGLIERVSHVAARIISAGCWVSYSNSYGRCVSEASKPISAILVYYANWSSVVSVPDRLWVWVSDALRLIRHVIVSVMCRDIN